MPGTRREATIDDRSADSRVATTAAGCASCSSCLTVREPRDRRATTVRRRAARAPRQLRLTRAIRHRRRAARRVVRQVAAMSRPRRPGLRFEVAAPNRQRDTAARPWRRTVYPPLTRTTGTRSAAPCAWRTISVSTRSRTPSIPARSSHRRSSGSRRRILERQQRQRVALRADVIEPAVERAAYDSRFVAETSRRVLQSRVHVRPAALQHRQHFVAQIVALEPQVRVAVVVDPARCRAQPPRPRDRRAELRATAAAGGRVQADATRGMPASAAAPPPRIRRHNIVSA